MKRKSDFITNSSSTSYIVIETWEVVSGDIKIYKDKTRIESIDITKQFIDFVIGLSDPEYKFMIDFEIVVNHDHLQLGFGGDSDNSNELEIELDYGKGKYKKIILWNPDLTLNIYDDKSIKCGFHYTTNEKASLVRKATDLLIKKFIKMLGITKHIDIEIERRVFECIGDGWDGGDPMGYYANSEQCKRAVECKGILTVT